jgi:hypothetical protein
MGATPAGTGKAKVTIVGIDFSINQSINNNYANPVVSPSSVGRSQRALGGGLIIIIIIIIHL